MFWYCTRKKTIACPAKARTDKDGYVLTFLLEGHNHEPPIYHVTENGEYVKDTVAFRNENRRRCKQRVNVMN